MPKKKIRGPDDLFDTIPREKTAVERFSFVPYLPGKKIYRTLRAVAWREGGNPMEINLDFPYADQYTFETKAILEKKIMLGHVSIPNADEQIDIKCMPAEIISPHPDYRGISNYEYVDETINEFRERNERFKKIRGYLNRIMNVMVFNLDLKLIPIYKKLQIPYPSEDANIERKRFINRHSKSKIIKAITDSPVQPLVDRGRRKKVINLDPKHLCVQAFTSQLGQLLEIEIFKNLMSIGIDPSNEEFEVERRRFLRQTRNSKLLQHLGVMPKPKKKILSRKKTKLFKDYKPEIFKPERVTVTVAKEIVATISKKKLKDLHNNHVAWSKFQPQQFKMLKSALDINAFSHTLGFTQNQLAKIWSWVDIPKDFTKCWEWRGEYYTVGPYIGQGIYVSMDSGTSYPIHKMIFMMYYKGKLPQIDLEVYHKCNNRICVNPSHMTHVPY